MILYRIMELVPGLIGPVLPQLWRSYCLRWYFSGNEILLVAFFVEESEENMRTIYFNGLVYTGTLPLVQAFAVEDNEFIGAGTNEEMLALGAERTFNLNGRFVCCGFNDSHMHLSAYGAALDCANLAEHTGSLEDLVAEMKRFYEAHPVAEGHWLQGRGWNQDYFNDADRMPTRYDLDQVSTEVPIMITRACGHAMVANTKALEIAGITTETVAPQGGRIGIENGELDGRFFDGAIQLVSRHIPAIGKEQIKNYIRLACRAANAYGVTSVQSDDLNNFPGVDWSTVVEAFKEVEAEGDLTVRVYEQSRFTGFEKFKEFVEAGNVTGIGSEFFKIGPLKMLGDGALGARTAYLTRPYADDPNATGLALFTQEEMNAMVAYANEHNMHVAIHAIGDGCLDMVLDAVDNALKACPREDHRHGVVHCQISRPDQLKRIADLNMHVYAQSIFLDYDNHIVETRVGKELASSSYSWKTLMDMGVSVSNGTDCPVELPYALGGIQCAVTRTSLHDHCGPYLPDQAFTVQEALDSYTIRSAEASFEENRKGQIKAGMLADFVILDENPFDVPQDAIKDIKVCEVYVDGRQVYKA